MTAKVTLACFAASALTLSCQRIMAVEPTAAILEQAYAREIRPLLQRFCHKCHGVEHTEAEINLAAIDSRDDVVRNRKTWEKVREMLDGGLMPPEDAPQPSDQERDQLKLWVHDHLKLEARSQAGDPGQVVLRRLSNAEYTYTIRDLTKVESLDPARDFPTDGAAGEGFTNVGNALVMSPALVSKYFVAAKDVASHAVLLPDGFRFSAHQTSRDWTEETLKNIREFYAPFTDPHGGNQVNLQGIVFETNLGGRLPVEAYLAATVSERDALAAKRKSIDEVAHERGLNARYLSTLWSSLTSIESSLILDGVRTRWRAAKPEDVGKLAAEIAAWQNGLWRFTTVGHIGKSGGPQKWMVPVSPLVTKQDLRFKIPPATDEQTITISLVASDAGDGNEHDFVIWQEPRLVASGRPDLLLRDVRPVANAWKIHREKVFADTVRYLSAAQEAAASSKLPPNPEALAEKYGIDAAILSGWLDILGIGRTGNVKLEGHFTAQLRSVGGYEFINGWGTNQTPLIVANSSDQVVRIPGTMQPHSVAVHPSPSMYAAVGWRSPLAAQVRIEGKVMHAHPECGNGVTWSLEVRRGTTREQLASDTAQGSRESSIGPIEGVAVRVGDVVSLLIGPRDGDHGCDLTMVNLTLTSIDDAESRSWDIAKDLSGSMLDGNPHADQFGNKDVWHCYAEAPAKETQPATPAGSLLAKWRAANSETRKHDLAAELQKLLATGPPDTVDSPDAVLFRQLTKFGGPLLRGLPAMAVDAGPTSVAGDDWQAGLDPEMFGRHPNGKAIDPGSLCVQAPSVIEVQIPTEIAAGCELVTTGVVDPDTGSDGSVQLQVIAGQPPQHVDLRPSTTTIAVGRKLWSDNEQHSYSAPVVVAEHSTARTRIEAAFDEFRGLFPAALCYTKIVPVDEVVTLNLFYREDDHLARLMLDEEQRQHIDRLWDELRYISQDALTLVDALEQLIEYATQDADPKVFEPLRQPFADRATAFRQRLIGSEPKHLDALIEFASRAYRRPLTTADVDTLKALYEKLRKQDIPHEDAFRLVLARILIAPDFLYRIERPEAGEESNPVSDWELASRLSYFLWSSQPDDELRSVAAAGTLSDSEILLAETRRMLRNAKTRRLATEFACQWLQVYDFENFDQKSERHFPTFAEVRGAMHEEPIRFFASLFQNDGSVFDILDADYVFVNEQLAQHYGVPNVQGPEWRRVDGAKQYSRGGVLAMAATLAAQSGASRTSPILRGNWISEVLLGEKLPNPPKGVPPLPDDEAQTEDLTVRQLVEKHVSDAKCAVCHKRIDPYGFALEAFDAVGQHRDKDLGDRPIDTQVTTPDGVQLTGLEGLKKYLLVERRASFVRQFCRKLLGYALGRAVQLSDEPLLADMQAKLTANDYHVASAFEAIVLSRQFREIRGRDRVSDGMVSRP